MSGLQTGPLPVLTSLNHVRSQRIPLHITQDRQIVFIRLNWERLESTLLDMPAAFVVPMITTNVRRHEPLHPATQVSIFTQPQQQVEMVCHETIPGQPHWDLFVSLPHQTHKRSEVIILVKDVTATIAPIQDMVNKPTS